MTKATGKPRGRPPTTGEKFGRLYVNVPPDLIAALNDAAARRGVSLSEQVRAVLADWQARQPCNEEGEHVLGFAHAPSMNT